MIAMDTHDHHGHHHPPITAHDHDEASSCRKTELRVRRSRHPDREGLYRSRALDAIVETYETKIGPHIGARIVARAWTDPASVKRLLSDASKPPRRSGTRAREARVIKYEWIKSV